MKKTTAQIVKEHRELIKWHTSMRKNALPSYLDEEDLTLVATEAIGLQWPKYEKSKSSVKTYLDRVVGYALDDFLEEMGVCQGESDLELEVMGVEMKADYKELAHRLGRDEMEREILVLVAEGFSQEEIAERMEVSQSTVSRTMSRISDYHNKNLNKIDK